MNLIQESKLRKNLIQVFDYSLLDSLRFQIRTAVKGLSKSEIDMLAYIFMYGGDGKVKYTNSGLTVSDHVAENLVTGLKKKGLLIGKGKTLEVANLSLTGDPVYYHVIINVKDDKEV